jgi:hypothetical protein
MEKCVCSPIRVLEFVTIVGKSIAHATRPSAFVGLGVESNGALPKDDHSGAFGSAKAGQCSTTGL